MVFPWMHMVYWRQYIDFTEELLVAFNASVSCSCQSFHPKVIYSLLLNSCVQACLIFCLSMQSVIVRWIDIPVDARHVNSSALCVMRVCVRFPDLVCWVFTQGRMTYSDCLSFIEWLAFCLCSQHLQQQVVRTPHSESACSFEACNWYWFWSAWWTSQHWSFVRWRNCEHTKFNNARADERPNAGEANHSSHEKNWQVYGRSSKNWPAACLQLHQMRWRLVFLEGHLTYEILKI